MNHMKDYKDYLIFYAIKLLSENKKTSIEESLLSEFLIKLNKRGINLTPIIMGANGLSTPYLKYTLQDYLIYHIIKWSSPIELTEVGKQYIDEKIKLLTQLPNFPEYKQNFQEVLSEI